MVARLSTNATLIFTMLLAAITHVGCGQEPRRPVNVVLITMDTVRADHLGCYGYHRPTSPRIDAFSARATLYSRALSTSPWTVPTHASLFTGLFPFEHGARTYTLNRSNIVPALAEDHITLAEVFAAEGYTTGAFVANAGWLDERMKMNQGFDRYHVQNTYADVINKHTFKWLERNKQQPFFLFINYIDAHRPYNVTNAAPFLDAAAQFDKGTCVKALYEAVMPGEGEVPQDLVQCMIDQYDTGVWNLDAEIGRLIDKLKEMKLYDNTMFVLTSDHGEYFVEHHLVEHSKDVYESAVWIPLAIKNPGQRSGEVCEDLTTSTDVAGLILGQCGDMTERYGDLFNDLPGNHEVIVENYYSRSHDVFNPQWGRRFRRVRTAIYDWPYKYIHSSDQRNELYRLDEDAAEARNLIEQEAGMAAHLAKRLEAFQSQRETFTGKVTSPNLTEEQLKQLKALGYLGY